MFDQLKFWIHRKWLLTETRDKVVAGIVFVIILMVVFG